MFFILVKILKSIRNFIYVLLFKKIFVIGYELNGREGNVRWFKVCIVSSYGWYG